MTPIGKQDIEAFLEDAKAVQREVTDGVSYTSGFIVEEEEKHYFVIIDDLRLPGPYLHIERHSGHRRIVRG